MAVVPIPAIDLMGGKVVRLSRGNARECTVYSEDPVAVAKEFEAAGAIRIHIVDLDGAFKGQPANWDVIRSIRKEISIEIEVGGGLRTREAIEESLEIGVDFAILGTGALRNRELVEELAATHGERLIVGIDARNGMVAVDGWVETSESLAADFARQMQDLGVGTVIATDIETDGMLTGPNLGFYRELAEAAPRLKLIASGGVRNLEDLIALEGLEVRQLIGAICGRSIYEKTLDLAEAMKRIEV